MMTSSNGNLFRVTVPLCGEFTGNRWNPPQRPVTQSFDVFFDVHLNKQLSEQSRRWWFELPSRSLWRHSKVKRNTNGLNYRPFVSEINLWKVGGLFSKSANNAHVVLEAACGKWEWRVWNELMAELISSKCWKRHDWVMEIKVVFLTLSHTHGLIQCSWHIHYIKLEFLIKKQNTLKLINMVRENSLQIPLPWGYQSIPLWGNIHYIHTLKWFFKSSFTL